MEKTSVQAASAALQAASSVSSGMNYLPGTNRVKHPGVMMQIGGEHVPRLECLREVLIPKVAGTPVEGYPIGKRMRATHWLRIIYEKAEDSKLEVLEILEKAAAYRPHGCLLRHEIAYVIGQLRDTRGARTLIQLLCDKTEDTILRHECAEALGAIGEGLEVLERLAADDSESWEVKETCEIARDFVLWQQGKKKDKPVVVCSCMLSPFNSVDPAPPDPSHASLSDKELGDVLLNTKLDMFDRYRAMFSLRNRNTASSIRELGRALVHDISSPLLRHEVAFVLGQTQSPEALPYLGESLRRKNEDKVVRHESAEALGKLEGCWEPCQKLLMEFLYDKDEVVRQSCEVSLDTNEYFRVGRELELQTSKL